MLTLVLADAELELVPEAVADHPQAVKPARRRDETPTDTLLDSSMHHVAMRDAGLEDSKRRGRPDLTHQFLLTALESALNLEGGLETHVHTRNHEHIEVDHATRLVRAYPRFKGLIESLFEHGEVGPADREPLLELTPRRPLPAIVKRLEADHVVALTPGGEPTHPPERIPHLAGEHDHVVAILGGFPHGDFDSPVDRVADEAWMIHEQPLSVWTAASEVLVHWRNLTRGIGVHRGPMPER